MNTIPTMLSDSAVPYTVVGGTRGASASGVPVSLVILDRGPKLFRAESLRDFDHLGFDSITCVEEQGEELFDIESLCQRFPKLRFILLGAKADTGTRINIAIRESASPFVFVLWNDMSIATAGLSGRFLERIVEKDRVCLAPFLSGPDGGLLPVSATPALQGSSLRILPLSAAKEGARSLYPFDYCGIYSRERFILLGGYDGRLSNSFWQRLDFGFRAWLWGEEIRLSQSLRVAYEEGPPQDDSTVDADYRWFWLKNIAPRHRGDSSVLPRSRFIDYILSRKGGLVGALNEFRAARAWVELNRFRFREDAERLVELWEEEGE